MEENAFQRDEAGFINGMKRVENASGYVRFTIQRMELQRLYEQYQIPDKFQANFEDYDPGTLVPTCRKSLKRAKAKSDRWTKDVLMDH